jgi:hypothetical protein
MRRLKHLPQLKYKKTAYGLAGLVLVAILIAHNLSPTSAAKMNNRHLYMSTAEISATAEYNLSFDTVTPATVGSISIRVCSNDPNPLRPCTVPAGLDMTNAALASESGQTGFSVNPTAPNRLILTRTPAFASPGPNTYDLQNIINPSTPGTYYIRILTYSSTDATGSYIDEGGIAYSVTNALSITATVPPYLTFCTGVTITGLNCANANGDYIDFGELSSTKASSGSSQMLAATNAQDGYNISITGTTMTSGTNAITSLASNDVSRPGTPQFGMNLRSNSAPAVGADPNGPGTAIPAANYFQSNSYRFNNGETLVAFPKPDDVREYTASYIVNVPKVQAPGIYVTTITYICLATF